jgi:mannose-6-phosphate isomerase-like protein (cupin superfamily)
VSLHAVVPGAGIPLSMGSSTLLVGLAEWSGGAFNLLDQIVPAGLIVPPHVHEHEAQASFVVSGTLGFWIDGEELSVGTGGYVHRPAGKPHSLWNATAEDARMLEITTPAERFERYMRAMSELIDAGDADPDSVAALASRYGVRFVPEPLADLCERHGVSPAGGFWK